MGTDTTVLLRLPLSLRCAGARQRVISDCDAGDKEAAAEAVAAAREALQAALAEAGIEFTMPEMDGQQPPELPNK